jgi:UDP-N-acetylmuramoylalanine--D-glutamate ligase
MILNDLKKKLGNKKLLILGFGKEGKDTYLALRKLFPKMILGIADKLRFMIYDLRFKKLIQKDKNLKIHFGANYLKFLKHYDIIIKTPGILPKTIKPYLSKNQKLTSQTKIFLENCPGKIVGVTGTKGKGTTACLIYEILKHSLLAGPLAKFGSDLASDESTRSNLVDKIKFHNVFLIGNIGKPVFQLLLKSKKQDIFVYELSSHQLMGIKKSPGIAVFINVYKDHLDYYKNFKEYIGAKENITKHQGKNDYFIYNSENKILKEISKKSKAKKISFSPKSIDRFTEKCLKTITNPENLIPAVLVGKLFGISAQKINSAIEKFKNQSHRLEFVGNFKGINFYNDSAATIPEATISAINALRNKVQTVILGGSEKFLDYSKLIKKILESNIKTLILFPITGEKIWKEFLRQSHEKQRSLFRIFFVGNMQEAVKLCYQHTKKGKICLLSPSSASFGLFKDYKERGNLFKKYVRHYGFK